MNNTNEAIAAPVEKTIEEFITGTNTIAISVGKARMEAATKFADEKYSEGKNTWNDLVSHFLNATTEGFHAAYAASGVANK